MHDYVQAFFFYFIPTTKFEQAFAGGKSLGAQLTKYKKKNVCPSSSLPPFLHSFIPSYHLRPSLLSFHLSFLPFLKPDQPVMTAEVYKPPFHGTGL